MKKQPIINELLVIIIPMLILGAIYTFAHKSAQIPENGGPVDVAAQSAKVHRALERIRGVTLDNSILESATYAQLVDFTRDVPKDPIGRADPFVAP